MEHKTFKDVLDSFDNIIVVNNNILCFSIDNLEAVREYILDKRDGDFEHCQIYELQYILWQSIYIIQNNFKFNDDEIKAENIKLGKQNIKWFVECNIEIKSITKTSTNNS